MSNHPRGSAVLIAIVGLALIIIPLVITLSFGHQPFPGTVIGQWEVVPVFGLLVTSIALMVIIQDLLGY